MSLLEIENLADFQEKWNANTDFSKANWEAVYKLFFDYKDIIKKDKNIWFNEIREMALYNLFYTDPSYFKENLQNEISDKLLSLQEQWTSIILECANDVSDNDNNYDILSFIRKGGQTTSHDFELHILHNNIEKIVKIEFKFSSNTKNKISQLTEFAAINTESASGLKLFGKSYLEFFWPNSSESRNYLQEICTSLEIDIPSDRTEWIKTAKSVSIPKTGVTAEFHRILRESKYAKNNNKKNIVNKSFDDFIDNTIEYIKENLNDISSIFNAKQENKFFCIFSSGNFDRDMIPKIILNDVKKTSDHAFELITNDENNIKCDMSWGNGGAGNQNPRVLFKLQSKEKIIKPTKKAPTKKEPTKKEPTKKRTAKKESVKISKSGNKDKTIKSLKSIESVEKEYIDESDKKEYINDTDKKEYINESDEKEYIDESLEKEYIDESDNKNYNDRIINSKKKEEFLLGGSINTIKDDDYEYEYEWVENNEELAIGDVDGRTLLNKLHGNKDRKIEFNKKNRSLKIITSIKNKTKSNRTKKRSKN
jgi:hypothetical protein